MELVTPPVGMAHITNDLSDLVRDRISQASECKLLCAIQPNSPPHIGTVTTLMCGFALAQKFKRDFKKEVSICFDQLENAPAKQINLDGKKYSLQLSQVFNDGYSIDEKNMVSYYKLLDDLSALSGVRYFVRTYSMLQANKVFRKSLLTILNKKDKFSELLSPSDYLLKVRFPCPKCGFSEKSSKTLDISFVSDEKAVLFASCAKHGQYSIVLTPNNDTYIDTNTSIRSVLKAVVAYYEYEENKTVSFMINGSDWAGMWLQRIYIDALAELGYHGKGIPLHIFTPLIVDWSGAKLSKSIYVNTDSYKYLSAGFMDYDLLKNNYRNNVTKILWKEVLKWIQTPELFFRNYSIDYLKKIVLKDDDKNFFYQ